MDPFAWWRDHKNKYPTLSFLAKKYLCVAATSTPSERLFSDAGNTMTAKRTKLNPFLFERIVFLKKNMKIVENIFPDDWLIVSFINK